MSSHLGEVSQEASTRCGRLKRGGGQTHIPNDLSTWAPRPAPDGGARPRPALLVGPSDPLTCPLLAPHPQALCVEPSVPQVSHAPRGAGAHGRAAGRGEEEGRPAGASKEPHTAAEGKRAAARGGGPLALVHARVALARWVPWPLWWPPSGSAGRRRVALPPKVRFGKSGGEGCGGSGVFGGCVGRRFVLRGATARGPGDAANRFGTLERI